MFHLAAFRGSVTNGTTNTAIAGVPDQAMTRDASGNFLAPPQSSIRFAAAGGINLQRERINTPSLREVALPYIDPVNQTLAVPSPPNLADFGPVGIIPRAVDSISVEATHSDAAPQVMYAMVLFQFGRQEQQAGKEYRTRFTATITGSAGTWQSGGITLDQVLPAGIYQVTGLDVFGTNLLGARLIFPGAAYRPGILARNAVNSVPHPAFTDGRLGVYGEFNSAFMPQLEIYVEAANTAQEGYMDLVKIGDYTP
jgi:hypothetical protein